MDKTEPVIGLNESVRRRKTPTNRTLVLPFVSLSHFRLESYLRSEGPIYGIEVCPQPVTPPVLSVVYTSMTGGGDYVPRRVRTSRLILVCLGCQSRLNLSSGPMQVLEGSPVRKFGLHIEDGGWVGSKPVLRDWSRHHLL